MFAPRSCRAKRRPSARPFLGYEQGGFLQLFEALFRSSAVRMRVAFVQVFASVFNHRAYAERHAFGLHEPE